MKNKLAIYSYGLFVYLFYLLKNIDFSKNLGPSKERLKKIAFIYYNKIIYI